MLEFWANRMEDLVSLCLRVREERRWEKAESINHHYVQGIHSLKTPAKPWTLFWRGRGGTRGEYAEVSPIGFLLIRINNPTKSSLQFPFLWMRTWSPEKSRSMQVIKQRLGFELTSAWLQRPCSFTHNKGHNSVHKNGGGENWWSISYPGAVCYSSENWVSLTGQVIPVRCYSVMGKY